MNTEVCPPAANGIGTPAASDAVVYERPDKPTWQFEPVVTRDGRYLVISIGDGQVGDRGEEQIAYLDLSRPGAAMTTLIGAYEAEYVFLGNDGPKFYFQTTYGALKKRVINLTEWRGPSSHWIPHIISLPHVRLIAAVEVHIDNCRLRHAAPWLIGAGLVVHAEPRWAVSIPRAPVKQRVRLHRPRHSRHGLFRPGHRDRRAQGAG